MHTKSRAFLHEKGKSKVRPFFFFFHGEGACFTRAVRRSFSKGRHYSGLLRRCFAFSLRYRPCPSRPSYPNALLPLVTHPLTPPPLSRHIFFFGRFSGVFPGRCPRSQHNKTGFLHNRHTPKTQDRSRVANAVLRSRRVFCWMEHFKCEFLFFHISRRNCSHRS